MTLLRLTYLVLAIVGLVLPMLHYFPWFQDNGFDLALLHSAWRVNEATSGLVWDMKISAIALSVFILSEVYIRKDHWVLLCIPAIYLVGMSFAFPLYLFLRSRPLD